MHVWVASETVNLTDRTAPIDDLELFEPQTNTIKLFAAANETISFQMVLDAAEDQIERVRFKASKLVSRSDKPEKIARSNIQAFRMWPVRIASYPPWYIRAADAVGTEESVYDPLTSVDAGRCGQPFDIAPNSRLALWVDICVPRGTPPGEYTGLITLTAGDELRPHDQRTFKGRVELTVYDFVLPDSRPIAAMGGFDHRTLFETFIQRRGRPYSPVHLDRKKRIIRRGLKIMRQLMRLGHEHRLDLFDRRIHPLLRRDASGEVRLDWSDYDAIVIPYLTGSAFEDGVGSPAWCVPFSEDFPDPDNYGGFESDSYAEVASKVIREIRDHFARTPGLSAEAFVWAYRGPTTPDGYARHARMGRIVRSADPYMAILSLLPPTPPPLTRWEIPKDFRALIDIYAPRGQWFDPNETSHLPAAARPFTSAWFCPGTPPYVPSTGLLGTSGDVRAFCWFAMKYKCTGLLFPEVLNWSGDLSISETGEVTRFFYPGTIFGLKEVLPSVRLKRLRRGLQDIAMLWLLGQRQRMGMARAITNAMVRYAGLAAAGDHYLDPRLNGWVRDPATWRMVRRILTTEVQSAVHPSAISNRKVLADRLMWRRFDERVHTIRLEQVRSRVSRTPGGEIGLPEAGARAGRLRANVLLEIYNEYSRSVDVTVKIDKLPRGWKPVRDEVSIPGMLPATREKIELTIEGDRLRTNSDGMIRLPISITADNARAKVIPAAVRFITAGRVETPMKIDGKLGDWPMRPGNTAGAFKLVGRRGQQGEGLAQTQTLVFAVYDENNLYFLFRCDEPDMSSVFARGDNTVHYAQLMGHGEDMVEIILDPSVGAKSPEDLYHIVVKANGVIVTERGVSSDPPLGVSKPWAAKASVAVGREEKFWTVEMAIPFSAFAETSKQPLWGVNFTRFSTQGAEASSWSGARRYFYDPRNLGTMFIPSFAK